MTIIISNSLITNTVNQNTVLDTTSPQIATNKTLTDPTNYIRASILAASGNNNIIVGNMAGPTAGQVLTAINGNLANWQTIDLTDTSKNIRATQLGTIDGGSVIIGNMTAPSAGQVLTAIDGNLASWQTPGAVSANLIFGSEYEYTASEGTSATTSNLFQDKINFTTIDKPIGTYYINYNYEVSCNSSTVNYLTQVLLDSSVVQGQEIRQVTATSQNAAVSGFLNTTFGSSATHTIQIQYAAKTGGTQVSIRRARIMIYRIS